MKGKLSVDDVMSIIGALALLFFAVLALFMGTFGLVNRQTVVESSLLTAAGVIMIGGVVLALRERRQQQSATPAEQVRAYLLVELTWRPESQEDPLAKLAMLQETLQGIRAIPEVETAESVTGGYDIIAIIGAKDLEAVRNITQQVRNINDDVSFVRLLEVVDGE